MLLLRSLWSSSRWLSLVVVVALLLDGAGKVLASALAGQVLVGRSQTAFVALAVCLGAAAVGNLGTGLGMARLTATWSAQVRRRLCRVALGQPMPVLETTPVGELLDRIDNDVYQVGSDLRGAGTHIVTALVTAVLSVATAWVVWWPAGAGMTAVAVALVLGLRRRTAAISTLRTREEEAWSDLAGVTEEAVHGQDDVRASLGRPYVMQLFADRASHVLARGRRVWRASAFVTTVATSSGRLGVLLVAVLGVWALTTGRADAARVTSVWLLALQFGGITEHVSRWVSDLQNTMGAWGRVVGLGASVQEPAGGRTPTGSGLTVTDLTFRYGAGAGQDDRRPALDGVSLQFRPGRSYAVVGRTGSGKSTLAKVLTRAVDVPAGTVHLGGVDVLDLDVEALRRAVALVPQRTEILAGTLAENVALFDPELLPLAGGALAELGVGDWVDSLPEGVHTRLGDGGHALSAGQEQLVAFARIMVRRPTVVVLDEATARLDPVTEAQVQRATARLLAGRIGIVIAHRLSSVRSCDEVVVLADGAVVEAGPLAASRRFADMLARTGDGTADTAAATRDVGHVPVPVGTGAAGTVASGTVAVAGAARGVGADVTAAPSDGRAPRPGARPRTDPPPRPQVPRVSTLGQIARMARNDPRFGLSCIAMYTTMTVLGLDGAVVPWLWDKIVHDPEHAGLWLGWVTVALVVVLPLHFLTSMRMPEWWVRQMLRIMARLVHGQTGPQRVSDHTAAEVVAQGGDTERVVFLADNFSNQFIAVVFVVSMTLTAWSPTPALFFVGAVAVSALAALGMSRVLERSARLTVAARAAFATALVSSLSAARTVKLAGATGPVLAHLARLDQVRSDRQAREISQQVWSKSVPALLAGLLPVLAWHLYLTGAVSSASVLIITATLNAAGWYAFTTASIVALFPSAQVWTRRTAQMCGVADYTAPVPGVDLSAGTAPAPRPTTRTPLQRLELKGFAAVHEDGTMGVHDVDLCVHRGELVLVVGKVGSGKSSLLRALAGVVHHTGALLWNGTDVTHPEEFLRPDQVGYVSQMPRVLSGTIADNVALGHRVDAQQAVSAAQLDHDLAGTAAGLDLVIGHKGTRLSGGQLQRLALARALAPGTEVLVADDVSSALDIDTELKVWRTLRDRGVTVVGSTSKRAALDLADQVLVLQDGRPVAVGPWRDLDPRWGHLAG